VIAIVATVLYIRSAVPDRVCYNYLLLVLPLSRRLTLPINVLIVLNYRIGCCYSIKRCSVKLELRAWLRCQPSTFDVTAAPFATLSSSSLLKPTLLLA